MLLVWIIFFMGILLIDDIGKIYIILKFVFCCILLNIFFELLGIVFINFLKLYDFGYFKVLIVIIFCFRL